MDRFSADGWNVLALSRRPPTAVAANIHHFSLDLRDPQACRAAAGQFAEVEHVIYAAVHEAPGLADGWLEHDQMVINLDMLRNLMEPLTAHARRLRHVSLLQGTKAYGAHLHPIPVPARERAPRDEHDNFYFLQEDYLRDRAVAADWHWTIWRPQLIIGGALGVAMNLLPTIGAFAAIAREEGRGFGFPGGPTYIWEAVDADLIAAAMRWAVKAPTAWNEIFNITNGDVFTWRGLWPTFAEVLGMESAPDAPMSLASYLSTKADLWTRIVAQYGLEPVPLLALLGESHHYADICFRSGATTPPPPMLVSGIKLRQAGFHGCMDTEDMFRKWFDVLVARRVLPGT
ncbi:Nucleoside-diphosphate-sugar epimerases [Sphingobium indicum BiD32]|uniref:Nucleoside-diphosphate-sugar epimerases n=1 Tax=Sphingobium indicum BiD32 TaxID=1301087 RepID=N1MP76_9SPHN|nr:Nucleoside-diphosphate-sugar epimerases [Sphingobium indicum BiD32]